MKISDQVQRFSCTFLISNVPSTLGNLKLEGFGCTSSVLIGCVSFLNVLRQVFPMFYVDIPGDWGAVTYGVNQFHFILFC